MPPDTIAYIFWLKNRRPAQWREGYKAEETPKPHRHDPALQKILKGLIDDEPQKTADEMPSRTKPSGRNGGDQR